jgi:tetratricopeptide (TPR) repeat protein
MFDDDNEEFHTGDIEQTLKRYEQMMVDHQPAFFDHGAIEELIEYYELRLDYAKALDVVNYGIDVYPFSSVFLIKKAGFLIHQKKYRDAMELLNKAESIDPNEIGIYLLRSDIFISKSQHGKALKIIENALTVAHEEEVEELYLEKADIYEDWGRYEDVYKALKECLEINYANYEALSRMWYTVELAGLFDDSVEFHKAIIEKDPYSYLAWYNLANAYYFLGLYEKAIDSYEFTIAINENYDLAHRECGDAYFKLRNYTKAIEYFTRAIEISKPYEDLHYAIGLCFERMKDFGRARLYYRKAINSDPKFHPAFFRIGITYKKEKHWQNALHFFRRALTLDEGKVTYILSVAEAAAKLGDENCVRNVVKYLLELHPNTRSRKAYRQLISCLLMVECLDFAQELVELVHEEKKDFEDILYFEAMIKYMSGSKSEAYKLLEDALFQNPEDFKVIHKFIPDILNDPMVLQLLELYRK